ncbi:MAG: hypothetical protein JO076_05530, partial [Verrucomicrobia bacterium]|nr:hypothetical protein [Verrucomicrobiota bacterium]
MHTSTPGIQSFQFEAPGIGDLSNSVNLLRGAVNHHQTLLKLPDRPGRSDLDIELSIVYESNVQDVVTLQNLDAPTGVLGVGWDLPLDRIVLDPGGTASAATRKYYLQNGDISTRLVRQKAAYLEPRLVTNGITPQDLAGPGISANLQQVFASNGIAVSQHGSVSANGNSTWTLTDTGNERIFALTASGPQVTVRDGGESYQLQKYQFWRVTYYAVFERWEIIKENGVADIYGGGLGTTARGYRTSKGNSIRRNVRWGNWLGDSSVSDGQQQYASF